MDLISFLLNYENLNSFKKVSDADISVAEKLLEVNFANDYREMVKHFGAISVDSHELTGLCSAKRLDVTVVTKEERKKHLHIPTRFYVIEQLQINRMVVWQNETGEIYYSTPGGTFKKTHNSLLSYLCD